MNQILWDLLGVVWILLWLAAAGAVILLIVTVTTSSAFNKIQWGHSFGYFIGAWILGSVLLHTFGYLK